jgi:hypothetical protein
LNRNRHDVADTMLDHTLGTSPSRPSRRDALIAESAPRCTESEGIVRSQRPTIH